VDQCNLTHDRDKRQAAHSRHSSFAGLTIVPQLPRLFADARTC